MGEWKSCSPWSHRSWRSPQWVVQVELSAVQVLLAAICPCHWPYSLSPRLCHHSHHQNSLDLEKNSVFILMLNTFCYVMLPLLISLRDIYCFHTGKLLSLSDKGKLLSLSDNLPFPYRIVSVWDIYYFLMGSLIFPCGRFTLSLWDIYSFFIYLLFPHGIFPYQIFFLLMEHWLFPDGIFTLFLQDISFPFGT